MKTYTLLLLIFLLGCKKQSDEASLVQIFVPNAFSPNSSMPCQDGNATCNKVFQFTVNDPSKLAAIELRVYDKNHAMVFKTNDYLMGWNGKLNNSGMAQEQGSYPYLIRYTDINQTTKTITGSVMLVR